jgi:hypothetical protein
MTSKTTALSMLDKSKSISDQAHRFACGKTRHTTTQCVISNGNSTDKTMHDPTRLSQVIAKLGSQTDCH